MVPVIGLLSVLLTACEATPEVELISDDAQASGVNQTATPTQEVASTATVTSETPTVEPTQEPVATITPDTTTDQTQKYGPDWGWHRALQLGKGNYPTDTDVYLSGDIGPCRHITAVSECFSTRIFDWEDEFGYDQATTYYLWFEPGDTNSQEYKDRWSSITTMVNSSLLDPLDYCHFFNNSGSKVTLKVYTASGLIDYC
jgi:hypothetical protein